MSVCVQDTPVFDIAAVFYTEVINIWTIGICLGYTPTGDFIFELFSRYFFIIPALTEFRAAVFGENGQSVIGYIFVYIDTAPYIYIYRDNNFRKHCLRRRASLCIKNWPRDFPFVSREREPMAMLLYSLQY